MSKFKIEERLPVDRGRCFLFAWNRSTADFAGFRVHWFDVANIDRIFFHPKKDKGAVNEGLFALNGHIFSRYLEVADTASKWCQLGQTAEVVTFTRNKIMAAC